MPIYILCDPRPPKSIHGKKYYAKIKWQRKDGTWGLTKTGHYATKKEAKSEGERRLLMKMNEEQNTNTAITTETIYDLLQNHIDSLESVINVISATSKNSEYCLMKNLKTLKKTYTPASIGNLNVSNLKYSHFIKWIKYINDDPSHRPLSGRRIRLYVHAISKFNEYLNEEGYYASANTKDEMKRHIYGVKLKPKKAGERDDRYVPMFEDFKTLTNSIDLTNGDFNSFYWYMLFTFSYYVGTRPEELVALQWKHLEYNSNGKPTFVNIVNAINEKEKKEQVQYRLANGIDRLKNDNSKRKLLLFTCCSEPLYDYKIAYQYHYGLTDDEMDEAFIFPNVTAIKPLERRSWQSKQNINRQLERYCTDADVPYFSVQMFRHGCCHFLLLNNLTEYEAHDYFGHQDSKMVREIYGALKDKEKEKRREEKLSSLVQMYDDDDREKNEDVKKYLLSRITNGEKLESAIDEKREQRLTGQVNRAISKGQETFQVAEHDVKYVESMLCNNPFMRSKIRLMY